MKKTFKIFLYLISVMIILAALNSCETDSPVDYKKDYYVEAYLFVDHPVEGIRVMSTQPVDRKFSYNNSLVKDASVTLTCGDETLQLVYRDDDNPGYYLPNTSYTVKPDSKYNITIRTTDGKVLTGETNTPSGFDWTVYPKPVIQYPIDTMNLKPVDSLNIAWTKGNGNGNFYLIETICQDTLDYGRYLDSGSTEKNRRCYNFIAKTGDESGYYKNTSNWAMVANTKTPTVWFAFKWFGKHTLRIYSPDNNMMKWFLNYAVTGSTYTDPNCNSISGGYGVFGSAAYISYEIFLRKNQN